MRGRGRSNAALSVYKITRQIKKVFVLLLVYVYLFISYRHQSNLNKMKYFDSLTRNTQRSLAYLALTSIVILFVLTMDFLLWLINTTLA
jgi:uncharacterized membrane protein YbaN (DUF454 family)